jgi:hypothetical protein
VQFDGFPVYLRGVGGSPLQGEVRVTSVQRIVATPDLFGVPRDYTARSAYSVLLGLSDEAASSPSPAAPAKR